MQPHFKRRNKSRQPCDDGKYDAAFAEEVMQAANCKPPYWPTNHDIPACSTMAQLNDIFVTTNNWFKGMQQAPINPPCIEIEKISYHYEERDIRRPKGPPYFVIVIVYASAKYKEIKQVKAQAKKRRGTL